MKSCNAPKNQPTRRTLPIACAIALAVASTVSLAEPVHGTNAPSLRGKHSDCRVLPDVSVALRVHAGASPVAHPT